MSAKLRGNPEWPEQPEWNGDESEWVHPEPQGYDGFEEGGRATRVRTKGEERERRSHDSSSFQPLGSSADGLRNGEDKQAFLERLRSKMSSLGAAGQPMDEAKERLPFSVLPAGFPKGELVQVRGAGKTELVVRFLAENPTLRVAWVEEKISIYPCAIQQLGAGLERILFVEAGQELEWVIFQILRSQLFDWVIASSFTSVSSTQKMSSRPQGVRRVFGSKQKQAGTSSENPFRFLMDEKTLRKLQLAAGQAQCTLVFLSDEMKKSWPISLELQVSRGRLEQPLELVLNGRRKQSLCM